MESSTENPAGRIKFRNMVLELRGQNFKKFLVRLRRERTLKRYTVFITVAEAHIREKCVK